MNRSTGAVIEGDDHLRQSIANILTTPIGTRIMRRDFGSLLPELIDQPYNAATRLRIFGATVSALMRWEPRISVVRMALDSTAVLGGFVLTIEARRARQRSNEYLRITLPLAKTTIH